MSFSIELMWFSPDAQFLVEIDVNNGSPLGRVLRLADYKQIATFDHRWRQDSAPQIIFSPSGSVFLEVGFHGRRLVELKTGRELHLFDSIFFIYNIAFGADERYLAINAQIETSGVSNLRHKKRSCRPPPTRW
jgi:hypothetical protein